MHPFGRVVESMNLPHLLLTSRYRERMADLDKLVREQEKVFMHQHKDPLPPIPAPTPYANLPANEHRHSRAPTTNTTIHTQTTTNISLRSTSPSSLPPHHPHPANSTTPLRSVRTSGSRTRQTPTSRPSSARAHSTTKSTGSRRYACKHRQSSAPGQRSSALSGDLLLSLQVKRICHI